MGVQLVVPHDSVAVSRLDIPLLKRRAKTILRMLKHTKSELSIALVGDGEIRKLNRDYRERDRSTDVLSFSLVDGDWAGFRGDMLGDVVISVDTAVRQARKRHRSLDEETARLLIHGVLHLVGHDHEVPEEYRRMRAEERRLSAVLRA